VDPVLEVLTLGNVRHVEAIAVDVVFPAVIDAAQTVLLVAAVKSEAQRCGQR